MIDLSTIKHIHIVGVGGIGVSALARLMCIEGRRVTATDKSESRVTDELSRAGVVLRIGNWPEAAAEAELLVFSKAVPEDDPDRQAAREAKVKEISYAELLGLVSQSKRTIAITGTHGKTTTTAMLATIAQEAGLDPTAIIGSIVQDFGSNLLVGVGELLITEACEYQRSFLSLHPYIMVMLNVDLDHLDYYKDLPDIQSAFSKLTDQIVPGGVLIYDSRDSNQDPIVGHLLKTAASRDITLVDYSQIALPIQLKLYGNFNQHNAQAAIAVAGTLSIDEKTARMTLIHFSGTWRRQEFRGESKSGVKVYDDYGHNPTEVAAHISAARAHFENEKMVVIFQPHLFSRTKTFLSEFATSFVGADAVIVLPIYAARETNSYNVSHRDLAAKINDTGLEAHTANSFDEALQMVKHLLPNGGVAITQGAGDVHKVGELILA
ncbi:MAG: UDP-N-acetylmuramate--L-alanine ligase [bacterium]|nr:UDP-N-acetylmuramate--L-alanine ligase [bacterium]